MASGRTHVQFVLDSEVRSEALRAVVERADSTQNVLEQVDASESAVYNALKRLSNRGLVDSTDDRLQATASGQLVTDLLRRRDRTERLFDGTDYWETHDASALPRQFRLRLPELSRAEVMKATDRSPHSVVEEVAKRVKRSETVQIISPIYVKEYDQSMPDEAGCRLVVDRTLAERALENDDVDGVGRFERTDVRIMNVDFALGICDDCLLLSLPTLDGEYDARAEVIAEDERSLAWGRELFDHCWERATRASAFV